MALTVSAGNLTLLRTRPVLIPKHHVSIAERVAVFSGQINGIPFIDADTLGYYGANWDNATGAYADVREGMSIDFGSTPGARDLGTKRIRYQGADATSIYFTESSPASAPISDNAYFTVIEEYRPWLVIPRGKGAQVGTPYTNSLTLYMDYDKVYTDGNEERPPKANITRSNVLPIAPKPAGWVDNYHTATEALFRTVLLDGRLSVADTDPMGTLSVYLWEVGDGTITVGTSASTNITVTFPAGFRYIHLTITDSRGNVGVMHYPIWVHNDTYLPLTHFAITKNTTSEWREMEFDFFAQDTDETVVPKGSAVCYWKTVGYAPIPDLFRDQFLGWAIEDTTLFGRDQARMALNVLGLGGWLDRFRHFPLRIFTSGNATETWFNMTQITQDKLAQWLLQNMSTALTIGNFFRDSVAGIDGLQSLDVTGSTIWGAFKFIVSGYQGRAGCTSLNDLWLRRHYSYMTPTERSTVTPLFALDDYDWTRDNPLKVMRRTLPPVGQVNGGGSAFTASNNLYASRASGRTPDEGAEVVDAPFQNLPYATAQTALNWLTGQHLAYLNNPRQTVSLSLLYLLDMVEPAWMLPIQISSDQSRSGLTLDNDLFLVKEVSIAQNDMRSREQVTFNMEGVTLGAPGQYHPVIADTYPSEDWEFPTEIPYIPWTPPPGGAVSRIPGWTNVQPINGILLSYSEAKAARMTSFDPDTLVITYQDISTGLTGTGIWYRSDPYDYRRGFALTTAGLYKCDDISNFTTWTLVANNATMFGDAARRGYKLLTSHLKRGWIMALSGETGAAVSFNYGASWAQVAIDGGTPSWNTSQSRGGDVAICGHNANHLYSTVRNVTNLDRHNTFRSLDGGLTWASIGTYASDGGGGSTQPANIEIPYKRLDGSNNLDDSGLELAWVGRSGGPQARLYRSYDQAASWTGVVYDAGEVKPTPSLTGSALHFFTHDSSYFAHMRRTNTLGSSALYTATDGGAGTSVIAQGISSVSTVSINGWSMDPNVLVIFSTVGGYTMTFDFGATSWVPNLPSGWAQGIAYVEFSLYPFIPPA